MIIKILIKFTKLSAVAAFAGYLTYTHHRDVRRFLNDVRFYGIEAEEGFVSKEQALGLGFYFGENKSGNLETYVLDGHDITPICVRKNGDLVLRYRDCNNNKTIEKERKRGLVDKLGELYRMFDD